MDLALASHAIESVDEIWLDDKQVWTAAAGVIGGYLGYFWVEKVILEGSAANAEAFESGTWNTSHRLTGCAYVRLKFKVTGNSKKAESPFSSGIPSRVTVIGKGTKLYDPRRDSTVPGGSGPMRAADQSTWRYVTTDGAVIGENLALQTLRVVLGWKIAGKLAVGGGMPAARLDLESFIVAANQCDELVPTAAGGTEPRYSGASVLSEGDNPKTQLDFLCTACNGRFRDTGGRLSFVIMHDDLATIAADDGLDTDDVIGAFTWIPVADQAPNRVSGRYVDPSPASLYQLVPYPEIALASPDGIDRPLPLDLGATESPDQAQRVANQALMRRQHSGTFQAPFDIRAWKYPVGAVVPFTFDPLGFVRKPFRVADQQLGQGDTCVMTLSVEDSAIYAAPVLKTAIQAATVPSYDPTKSALVQAIAEAGGTAARRFIERTPRFVLTSDDTSITIAAMTGVLDDGTSISLPAAKRGGLTSGLYYGIFWDTQGTAGPQTATFSFAGGTLPTGATLTRASVGTRIDASGARVSMAADAARFDYSTTPIGSLRGLLVEASRTNSFLSSTDLTASWTAAMTTPSATALIENTATGNHQVSQSMSFTSGQPVTISAVASERSGSAKRYLGVFVPTTVNGAVAGATFDLAAGTVSITGSATATITATAGGWLCTVTITPTATVSAAAAFRLSTAAGSIGTSYAGNGSAGVNLSELQFEAGSAASTRIRTTTAAVTRAADVLTLAWGDKSVPDGAITATVTFDDGSTQAVALTVAAGKAVLPTALNRPRVRSVATSFTAQPYVAVVKANLATYMADRRYIYIDRQGSLVGGAEPIDDTPPIGSGGGGGTDIP